MQKVPQTREITLTQEAINEENRTAVLSFASETPVRRWYGSEVLQIDTQSVDMQRIKDGLCCLLYNHDTDEVIGKVMRAWIEDGKAKAEVYFDDDEKSERVWQKVRKGILKGVSVGYIVDVWEKVEEGAVSTNGRITGPAYIATRWNVYEISIVSVPADSEVGVGRAQNMQEGETGMGTNNNLGNESKNTNPQEGNNRSQANNIPPLTDKNEGQTENERVRGIVSLCREFNIENERMDKFLVNRNMTIRDVEHEILEGLKRDNKPSNTAKAQVGTEEREKFRAAATDAIMMREGFNIEKPAPGATELMGAGIRDYMIYCVKREQPELRNLEFMDVQELARVAMTGTGALPGILSNVANKSMAQAYAMANTTYQTWTSKGNNKDFKEATRYRIGEAGELLEIKESGEFKFDTLKEASAKAKVLTYGRAWSLTRQAIINDDLGALTTIPTKYAYAAVLGINKLVYKTLADTSTLFTSARKNLGTAGKLSVTTLGEARKLMRNFTNIGSKEKLNIAPKFLIVPSTLETEAQQLLQSTADPQGANSGVNNPFRNALTLICDSELDQYSEKAWYLAADPMLAGGGIEVTYLNGKNSPTIDSQVSFKNLGMDFRIYIDYGVNIIDWRAFVKNAGQA